MGKPVVTHYSTSQGEYLKFECLACNDLHIVTLKADYESPTWTWNGSLDKPSIQPSVNVTYRGRRGRVIKRCHFFVKQGHIEYCNDCTHDLKGSHVQMTPVD